MGEGQRRRVVDSVPGGNVEKLGKPPRPPRKGLRMHFGEVTGSVFWLDDDGRTWYTYTSDGVKQVTTSHEGMFHVVRVATEEEWNS